VHTEYKLEWTRINPGYPVKVPVVDIVEIGAGGGSIARFDATGALQVGPASAGAEPGPACYGRGGMEPTVTDAMLLAGVLNPDYFAGGRIRLDRERAALAMEQVAAGLKTDVETAAVGVLRVVEANMINALKLVSIQRGHDPRDFVLIAAGGGGPMHATSLGRELGVKETIIPRYPSYFSAWGMLVTEPRRDFVQTALIRASEMTGETIHELFRGLRAQAEQYFRSDLTGPGDALAFECRVDLRYLGQEHSVTVPVDLARASVESILVDFHAAHERAYTFRLGDTPIEFVNFRLKATARAPRPQLRNLDGAGRSAEAAAKGRRYLNLGEEGWWEADVLERDQLPAGFSADGPLIVEERSSTTLVLPGQQLRVDDLGFLRITEI
jgi:N-methylhydantoinase A